MDKDIRVGRDPPGDDATQQPMPPSSPAMASASPKFSRTIRIWPPCPSAAVAAATSSAIIAPRSVCIARLLRRSGDIPDEYPF